MDTITAETTLDMKAGALQVLQAALALEAPPHTPAAIDAHARLDLWCRMTDSPTMAHGVKLAEDIANASGAITAAVVPF